MMSKDEYVDTNEKNSNEKGERILDNKMELVFEKDGEVLTDSLIVAEAFEKEPARVMRDIRDLDCSEEFRVGNFAESFYTNKQGRETPKVVMTQDGFTFLAMGYTGKTASQYKEKYIKEFNRMKHELKNKNTKLLPTTYKEALIALVEQVEEKEKLQLRIEEQQPFVLFAQTALKSKDNILVRELSKIIQDEGINIGEKKLFKKLREWKLVLTTKNEPTQYAMNQKLFVVEESSIQTPYGVKLTRTLKVTPKGQVYIIEKLKKEMVVVAV
jgi:Rha family phage regulatory protein